jgi:hypothetical protein
MTVIANVTYWITKYLTKDAKGRTQCICIFRQPLNPLREQVDFLLSPHRARAKKEKIRNDL